MNQDPTISLDKYGRLRLFIPGQRAKGHHVTIPLTLDGLKVVKSILQERAVEKRSTIGMNGSPTQEMVQEFLAKNREIKAAERVTQVKKIIPGLDLSTLKL